MMFMFQEKIFGVWAIYYIKLNNVTKKGMLNQIERLFHHFSKEKLVYASVSIGFLQSAWHSTECDQTPHMFSYLILFVSDRNV